MALASPTPPLGRRSGTVDEALIVNTASMSALRIGILGWGAIGQALAGRIEELGASSDLGIQLTAVGSRFSDGSTHPLGVDPAALGEHCDVVVEAAGPAAVRENVAAYLDNGTDVVLLSLGALAESSTRSALLASGPGRLMFCSGAIGGVDIVEAAKLHGTVHHVRIETTKPATVLEREWMTDEMRTALRSGTEPVECFRGTVAEAVTRFPESLNVSAALALAAGSFEVVEVVVTGSPSATSNRHDISVEADSGSYRVAVTNTPSPDNPKTSHVTAWAALRSVRSLAGVSGTFV